MTLPTPAPAFQTQDTSLRLLSCQGLNRTQRRGACRWACLSRKFHRKILRSRFLVGRARSPASVPSLERVLYVHRIRKCSASFPIRLRGTSRSPSVNSVRKAGVVSSLCSQEVPDGVHMGDPTYTRFSIQYSISVSRECVATSSERAGEGATRASTQVNLEGTEFGNGTHVPMAPSSWPQSCHRLPCVSYSGPATALGTDQTS